MPPSAENSDSGKEKESEVRAAVRGFWESGGVQYRGRIIVTRLDCCGDFLSVSTCLEVWGNVTFPGVTPANPPAKTLNEVSRSSGLGRTLSWLWDGERSRSLLLVEAGVCPAVSTNSPFPVTSGKVGGRGMRVVAWWCGTLAGEEGRLWGFLNGRTGRCRWGKPWETWGRLFLAWVSCGE